VGLVVDDFDGGVVLLHGFEVSDTYIVSDAAGGEILLGGTTG
jgi:hypothetical protein